MEHRLGLSLYLEHTIRNYHKSGIPTGVITISGTQPEMITISGIHNQELSLYLVHTTRTGAETGTGAKDWEWD